MISTHNLQRILRIFLIVIFFFSSRRRHTRFDCDWSSDVCSSDLRALPPEMIPQNLFDRLFGVKNTSWVTRKKSVLDLVKDDVADLQPVLGKADKARLDEHLTSVRDLERAVASLPPDYGKNIKEPEDITD